jgi:AcrR family transcriptional regulator
MGLESAKTRVQLIEAAAQIVRDEGYGALTARRLAEMVGLKRQIVHYYFRTIDDLLVAVARHMSDSFHQRFHDALNSDEPLRATLELAIDATAMTYELVALALRRKAIGAEMKRMVEELRRAETDALARYMQLRGIKPQIPPLVMTFVMRCVAQSLAVEAAIGVSIGHVEAKAFIEDWLRACAGESDLPVRGLVDAPKTRVEPKPDGLSAISNSHPPGDDGFRRTDRLHPL